MSIPKSHDLPKTQFYIDKVTYIIVIFTNFVRNFAYSQTNIALQTWTKEA